MSQYTINTGTSAPETVTGAAQAIRRAADHVYLDTMRQKEHIERLEQTGRTAWAYGFASVLIEKSHCAVPDMEKARTHYAALAREAADRTGEPVLPEHRA